MSFRSFEETEKSEVVNFPNVALTGTRLVGGIALGAALAANHIDPSVAALAAGVLGATDAEGNLIDYVDKHPPWHRLRDRLHIFPTKFGRKADPVADKVFGISTLAGGMIGGYISLAHGLPILVTEVGTATVSVVAEAQGREPQVTKLGKAGLAVRVGVIMLDLFNNNIDGPAHELIQKVTNVGVVA